MRFRGVLSGLVLVLALAGGVEPAAGQSVQCYSSERFGGKLIRTGDSERRVIEAKPDRTVQLQTAEGGAAGYRHDFYKQGRTVQIYVQSGIVTRICVVREL